MAPRRVKETYFTNVKQKRQALLVGFWPNAEAEKQLFYKIAHMPKVSILLGKRQPTLPRNFSVKLTDVTLSANITTCVILCLLGYCHLQTVFRYNTCLL